MFKTILALILMASLPAMWAQPHELNLPKLRTDKAAEDPNAVKDPLANYGGEQGRHEAAIAAFQAGYQAAGARPFDRAIRLFLISLHREPMPKTLYDLGIVCARDYRWEDALGFQREAQQQTQSPEVAKLAESEIERLQTIAALEGSPTGKQAREFDIQFIQAVRKAKDPIAALDDLKLLIRKYNTRWEAPAMAGVLYAEVHKFPESLKALETAAGLGPPDRRQHLAEAAELARREANFDEQRISADELWDKKEYESAAQHYATAWENSLGRLDVGMLAATGYLMADRVDLAAAILSRMHVLATGDMADRIVAMLKELGAVSQDAARAAAATGGSRGASNEDTPTRMRALVGSLTSRQMELAATSDPPLIPDKTTIPHVPDDELTGSSTNLPLLSTDRVYDLYKRDQAPPPATLPSAEPGTNPAAPAMPTAVVQPAAKPVATASIPENLPPTPSPEPTRSQGDLPHAPGEVVVPVAGGPPGVVVAFDDRDDLKCTTPCQIALAPGRHTWRAAPAGYRVALGVFNIDKGKKPAPVNVSLVEKAGFVTVESAVAGQPVFVNGQKTANLTPCRLRLKEGVYKLAIEADGKTLTQEIEVKDEGWTKIKF